MFTAKWDTDGGHDIVKLEGAQQEVRIMPVNGFNFYFWAYDGQQIMMETTTAPLCSTKHGTPILFPMPNRVRDAVYRWNGEEKTLTKRGEKVPCHGLVRDEAFTVTDMGADDEHAYCTACIRIAPGDGLYEGYPFACCLSVTYALSAQGVRMDAQITNEGMELMPFGLALHP